MTTKDFNAIRQAVERYYTDKIAHHGPTSKGVDWKDQASHELRHQQFLRLLGTDTEASVGDLGCGFGDFLRFLRVKGHTGPFFGYDLSEAMLDAARRQHAADRAARWICTDRPAESSDYVIASGLFNVRGQFDDAIWRDYMYDVLDGMARAARKGFAFNVLSLHSDPAFRRADLYYADPAETLSECVRRYSRRVALLQDCGLYEFTLMVRVDS